MPLRFLENALAYFSRPPFILLTSCPTLSHSLPFCFPQVDGLSDDHKIEAQRDIYQRANDDLVDAGLEGIHLGFYLTSIYDHSIFEAFSKVVQKLIPQLPTLENLLNILISNSGIEKAFLFDVVSKIYIATDSSPVDMQSYELCCDMIDVVIDMMFIYGVNENHRDEVINGGGGGGGSGSATANGASGSGSSADSDPAHEGGCAFDTSSSAVIRLNNATVLYMRNVNKYLALVCILREDSFDFQGLIDYNFHCFRRAIQDVFELRAGALAEKLAMESAASGSSSGKKTEVRTNGDVEPDEESGEGTQET